MIDAAGFHAAPAPPKSGIWTLSKGPDPCNRTRRHQATDDAPTAGSGGSPASAKKRSVFLTLDAEPSVAAARGPRERHVGAAHVAAVEVLDRHVASGARVS